jgi:PAS domain S-box-containing protein
MNNKNEKNSILHFNPDDPENMDQTELCRQFRQLREENQLLKKLLEEKTGMEKELLKLMREKLDEPHHGEPAQATLDEFKSLLNYFEYEVLRQLQDKEDELIRQSTNLSAVIESTNMGIALLDENGKLLEYNRIFKDYFFRLFQREIAFSDPLLALLQHTKWHHRWEKLLEEKQLRKAAHFVEKYTTADGKRVLLEIKAFPIFQDEHFKGASIFVEDITRRHFEQEQLRLLNSAVVHARDAICITASNCQDSGRPGLVYLNDSFTELTGYPEDEVLGKNLEILYGQLTAPEELDKISQAMNAGESHSAELLLYRKDGSSYWSSFSIVPLKNERQETTHWIMVHRDISEKKEAENTILESKQLLESINRNIKEAIIRADESQQIAYTNQAYRDMFGYSEQDSMCLASLFASEDMFATFNSLLQEKGMVSNLSYLFRRKDGSTFWGLTSFLKTEFNGISFLDGAIRDITERKEAEKILEEKNLALVKTNEELDRFVYSASHDLRAPLASTLGLINISRITDSDRERISYLEMMEQSLNRMDKIIQDITDYSRNARLEIETEKIQFQPLIDDVLQRLKYLKGIDDVRINIALEGECCFFTDKIRLYVILINLISNAVKYHRFEENDPYVHVRVEIKPDTVRLLVQDNGIGIEDKHLDKIFGMFFQAARESAGSGLGLYIVKETVSKLGGQLNVSSKLNVGTSFEVLLPNDATAHRHQQSS